MTGVPASGIAPWTAPPVVLYGLPPHNRIDIWRVSIAPRLDEPALELRRSALTSLELARADRFATTDLSTRWVLGRSALRLILSRYLDVGPHDVLLTTESHGKPILDGVAMGRESSTLPAFNLSHAGDLALLAVSRPMSLGIDVELVREVRDAERICGRFFSVAEQAQFERLAIQDRAEGFFRCWTRKEAFIKAVGEGLSRPLATFDVSFAEAEPARIVRVGDDPAEADLWWMSAFVPASGYLAAVVARTGLATLAYYDFDASAG